MDTNPIIIHVKNDSVYFDAVFIFHQGPGLLVSDDDTAFHGEFSDDWTANGKVERMSHFVVWLSVCHVDKAWTSGDVQSYIGEV